MIKRLGDSMAWLGGGEKEMLIQLPQERSRFVQMAGVLLTTSGIAVISMIFALHNGVKVSLIPSIFFGLLWGVVILNLDRFLVLSMTASRSVWHQLGIALPRLALAVVLALVISTPLVLRIFASDINEQLFKIQLESSKQNIAAEKSSGDQQEANRLHALIATDQSTLDGHLPQSITSPQLQNAQARVNKLQPQAQSDYRAEIAAREAWQCELDGQHCAGASGLSGNGPRAQAKHLEYQQAVNTYNSATAQLTTAENTEKADAGTFAHQQGKRVKNLQDQARRSLPGLQHTYNSLEARIQATITNGDEVDKANTGLLAQLQALSEASAKSPGLEGARLAVLALFFLIEIMPVTVKFLLNLGPPSTYDIAVKLKQEEIIDSARAQRIDRRRIEEEAIDSARAKRDESRRIEERHSEKRINVADDMVKREEGLGKQANKYVAGEMTKILDAALKEWSTQVQARLSGDGSSDGHKPSNGAEPPPDVHFNPGYAPPDGGKL